LADFDRHAALNVFERFVDLLEILTSLVRGGGWSRS